MILNNGLSIGYIENKRVNADLDSLTQSPQIHKYLSLSDNIMLTDYLRFCLVRPNPNNKGEITKEVRICELSQLKAITKDKSHLESKAKELLELFTLFFTHSPKPINTALEFANTLSLRTRLLKDELLTNQVNTDIVNLYHTFRKSLYQELEFDVFADSFAQTLTYSLFLARLNNNTNKEIDLFNAKKFIPRSFPLIKAMSGFLDNLEELDSIRWLLEEILTIINHINIADLTKELNAINQKNLLGEYEHKDPYLHFYETFLSSYDPKLRELRGVYYTPASVVRFIINAIDFLLKRDFGQKQGLASAMSNEHITLLDFATGTGTFLLEVFRKAQENIPKNSPKSNPKALIQRFYGFEFLIAPYTIAHLKISQCFKEEFDEPLSENESLNIKLTNTLYFKTFSQEEWDRMMEGLPKDLAKESREAQEIKEGKILIITGNPPYSGASSNKGLYEKEVQEAYKEPMESLNNPTALSKNGKIQKEINSKWLLDDYVKFIRFAESKIESQDSGIFAFISNNSFLDNPTFRGMRYHLMQSFDKLYILDLHGSTRKKELTPDGGKDDNVFDIQQGVSINIFVKTRNDKRESKEPHCQIYHYDLYGKRKDKYDFLYDNTLDSIPWQILNPKPPFYLFIPQNEALREEYDKGISVKDMFRISGVGICSKRDHIVFHNSKESLKKFLQDFIVKPKEELYRIYDIGEDSRDWKLDWAIESIKENKDNLEDFIMKCHYRPFDYRYTYYINKSRAFMAYPVYDIFEHFLQDHKNKALLVSRQASAIGEKDFDAASTKKNLKKGEQGTLELGSEDMFNGQDRIENFTPEFRAFVDSKYTWDSKDIKANPHLFLESNTLTPEAILGYIYAMLFHKDYREKYIDFLKIDFPKIPFVESKEKFIALSKLGLELMSVHLMQDNRERETRAHENESQYSVKYRQTIQTSRELAICDSNRYDSGFMPYGRGQHGSGADIPSLSLQHRARKEDSMQNIGLVCDRGCKLNKIDNIFITQNIIDLHLVGSGSYVFPLYLYDKEAQ